MIVCLITRFYSIYDIFYCNSKVNILVSLKVKLEITPIIWQKTPTNTQGATSFIPYLVEWYPSSACTGSITGSDSLTPSSSPEEKSSGSILVCDTVGILSITVCPVWKQIRRELKPKTLWEHYSLPGMLAKEPGQATQVALPLGLSQILTDSHSPRKVERKLKNAFRGFTFLSAQNQQISTFVENYPLNKTVPHHFTLTARYALLIRRIYHCTNVSPSCNFCSTSNRRSQSCKQNGRRLPRFMHQGNDTQSTFRTAPSDKNLPFPIFCLVKGENSWNHDQIRANFGEKRWRAL